MPRRAADKVTARAALCWPFGVVGGGRDAFIFSAAGKTACTAALNCTAQEKGPAFPKGGAGLIATERMKVVSQCNCCPTHLRNLLGAVRW